ncbi:MAG: FAD-dependent oxidoreductase [Pseudomonadota bacterium]
MAREKLVIVGAGMASGRVLDHLTDAGASFDITVFNAEPRGTYNRLMLSPVLAGEKTFVEIVTHSDDWYAAHGITARFGERVLRIDARAREVVGEQGAVPYDKLIVATGSYPFMIPLPGHDLDGVIAYRDLEDTKRMMNLQAGTRAVVIGGGLLGLEAAAGMAARGIDVSVVHIMDHLMERQLDADAAGQLAKSLRDRGIRILCGAQSEEIIGAHGHVTGLRLKDGRVLGCDLIVMAVGIRPSVALAQDAGVAVDRAIVVDDQMRTSVQDIYALGECVEHRGAVFGLVAPLFEQAKVLADTLMGRPAEFVHKSLATKLKVTGCDLFSAGDFADADGRENLIYRDDAAGVYKRLILENNRLLGAVMYGDTGDGAWFFDLIQDGCDVSHLRDVLMFGPNNCETPERFPRSSVAA